MYVLIMKNSEGTLVEEYRTRTQAIEAAAFLVQRGYKMRSLSFDDYGLRS